MIKKKKQEKQETPKIVIKNNDNNIEKYKIIAMAIIIGFIILALSIYLKPLDQINYVYILENASIIK